MMMSLSLGVLISAFSSQRVLQTKSANEDAASHSYRAKGGQEKNLQEVVYSNILNP
jgi:hypothetical protein